MFASRSTSPLVRPSRRPPTALHWRALSLEPYYTMTERPKLPPARVRRLLDVEPLPAPRALKLRPFLECFDRGSDLSGLILQGRIHHDQFEVSINGTAALCLPARAEHDEHGPFVWLPPQEHAIGDQHALRIDADAHDIDASLAALSYFELPRHLVARAELAYASRWYSVYFNALGLVDGCGSGGPRSVGPARMMS